MNPSADPSPLESRTRASSSRWRRIFVVAGLFLCLVYSCEDGQPAVESAPEPAPVRQPLPSGDRDEYGLLPEKVGDWRVTRGAAPGYVSDQSCKECHESIFESYQDVGMAQSFYRPDPAKAVEKFGEVFHQKVTDYYYVMTQRDGKLYQKRYCMDADGNRFAELEVEVAWIVGSGHNARTYISQSPNGEMFQLPLSWYSHSGWGMSPGYDITDHGRFERVITRECMFCHNAYPEVPVGNDLLANEPKFPLELPHGIGCQRCHGPGARHVELALNEDADEDEVRRRIINPENFTPRQKEDLCFTCHLQPESMKGLMMPHHVDRPVYSVRPGDNLTDFIVYMDHGDEKSRRERLEINHHAYRMRWSKCYTGSAGGLTCLSCHDPHRKVPKTEQPAFYRNKCVQCHKLDECTMEEMGKTIHPAESDCVSCHMVQARPDDVVNALITDHFIRRGPPDEDMTAPKSEQEPEPTAIDPIPYFPDRYPHGPERVMYEGFARSLNPSKEDLHRWRASIFEAKPETAGAYVSMSRILADVGDHDGAVEIAREAVRRFPWEASAHWRLGHALHMKGLMQPAIAALEKADELRADDAGILHSLAAAYSEAGEDAKARPIFERSLELRPNSPVVWTQYASVLMALRDVEAAIEAFEKAIAYNPDTEVAYETVSEIYKAGGDWENMLRVLNASSTRFLSGRLGLVVALLFIDDPELCDPDRALEIATEATKNNPDNGRCHMHLALAMIFGGKPEGVLKVIETARARGADEACCEALVAIEAMDRNDAKVVNERLARYQQLVQTASQERLLPVLHGVLRSRTAPSRKK